MILDCLVKVSIYSLELYSLYGNINNKKYKNHRNSQEVRDLGNRENKIWSKADIEARNKAIEEALRDFVTK